MTVSRKAWPAKRIHTEVFIVCLKRASLIDWKKCSRKEKGGVRKSLHEKGGTKNVYGIAVALIVTKAAVMKGSGQSSGLGLPRGEVFVKKSLCDFPRGRKKILTTSFRLVKKAGPGKKGWNPAQEEKDLW